MGQTLELGRCDWVIGALNLNAGDIEQAKGSLAAALRLATQANDEPTVAWSKVYLSRALAGSDPARARQLKREGVELAGELRGKGYEDMGHLLGDEAYAQR
jgi:hypothetical protein